jgi:hypothetical protein
MRNQDLLPNMKHLKAGALIKDDEVLVPDMRGYLTPAQMVDHKLVSLLDTCPVLVSHLQDMSNRRPR